MRRRAFTFGLVALALRRAVAGPTAGRTRAPWIRLETRACLGTCPVFTLLVYRDGEVVFDGLHCVMHKGQARSRLAAGEITRLEAAIGQSNFWNVDEKCCNCRDFTDAPWTIIEIARDEVGGSPKTIEHYYGCESAPKTMETLEREIISLTGAGKWIGTQEERKRQKWGRNRC